MTIKYAQIGAISSGTLRTEDLLQAFADELEYHVKRNKGARGIGLPAKRKLVREAYAVDAGDELYADEIVQELSDALETFAPPYAYFGANEGDGACFGFWPCVDMHGDCDDLPKFNDSAPDGFEGDCLLVSDHGNVMCGRKTKKGFVKYWACV